MFRNVPECSMFRILSTPLRFKVSPWSNQTYFQITLKLSAGSKLVQTSQIIITIFKTSAAKFTAAFRSDDILSLLLLFESTKFDLSSTDVENATNQFTNIMTEAAKRSLKLLTVAKTNSKGSQLLRNGLIMIAKLWDLHSKSYLTKNNAIHWIPNSEKNIMSKIKPFKEL